MRPGFWVSIVAVYGGDHWWVLSSYDQWNLASLVVVLVDSEDGWFHGGSWWMLPVFRSR